MVADVRQAFGDEDTQIHTESTCFTANFFQKSEIKASQSLFSASFEPESAFADITDMTNRNGRENPEDGYATPMQGKQSSKQSIAAYSS